MTSIFIDDIPEDFPAQLFQSAWHLRPIHMHELAWPYPAVLQTIEALGERGYVVLGGDVYYKPDHQLEMTFDNWYIERREQVDGAGNNWALYVQAGAVKAHEYIERFHARHGADYWYLLVVSDEAHYVRRYAQPVDRP